MTTIPASTIADVTPGVLVAGGSALDLTGLMLSTSTRVPIGTVKSFTDLPSVQNFFGAASTEADAATKYFLANDNSTAKPGALLAAQYNTAAVSAYLRGGNISALALAALQAISGTLSIVVDGVTKSGSPNLSAATSFSNAAVILAETLEIDGAQTAAVTASIGGTATTSTTGGTGGKVLTLGALATGTFQPGDTVTGTDGVNTLNTTIVSQLTGTPGGSAGATFQLAAAAAPGNLGSATVTAASETLHVTVLSSGTVGFPQVLVGSGVTDDTYINSQITPLIGGEALGGIGRYALSGTGQTVVSEAMTVNLPGVIYDSQSGAFVVTSGTTGAASTLAFATGTIAATLLLTSAAGAVLSQGAIAAVPATFMANVIVQTQNWATFFLTFDPDNSGNAKKLAFAAWTATTVDRYAFICWDTDAAPLNTVPAASSLGVLVTAASYSGTCVISAPDYSVAAFISGAAAAIDFTALNGRTDFAFLGQSGLSASVTDAQTASNLIANGYNYYGAYATANQGFVFFYNGAVSGPFKWLDSYVNQIWLNNGFQLDAIELLTNSKSVPYNTAGEASIEAAYADTVNAGLNFGAIRTGIQLSTAQIAAVNNAAGANVAPTIASRGWYLQVLPASPSQRAARASPPAKFFYTDGQSVQQLNLASVEIQ